MKALIYSFFIVSILGCSSNSEKIYIVSDMCSKCDGEGKTIIKCEHCNGSGVQWSNYDLGNGDRVDCIECVHLFCGHDVKRSHEADGKTLKANCAKYKEYGASVGEVYGDCTACNGSGRN
jgi:hypothetical protein